MEPASADATSVSLLFRLRQSPTDESAWRDFVARYGRRVYLWCRQWHLQQAEAEDVTQNVLLILAEKLREFQYDPGGSFRAWLKTVSHHAWGKYMAGRRRPGLGTGDSDIQDQLQSVAARDDLAARLAEEYDRELLDAAMIRAAARVESHTWHASTLTALDGLSGADAADRLGISVGMVYVARSRVQKLVKDELQRLEAGQ